MGMTLSHVLTQVSLLWDSAVANWAESMILYVFLTALTLLLTKWYFERKKKFQILANYGYNVPPINFIAGNLHQIAKDDIGTMEDWMERYGEEIGEKGGKIMGWYRGPNPALWTSSPELLKVSSTNIHPLSINSARTLSGSWHCSALVCYIQI